ncbi:MAG: molecular chaperone DnaJ [Motiliproteus sp.]|nr:molecular chaperone DnaJ [Motiliproteus sp.]MCW9054257.1 molecular chaperone DnaJ [Motiliproteus sp.]
MFLQRAPKYGPGFLRRIGLIALALILIYLAMTGRLHWLLGLLAGLLPFMRRLLPLLLPLLRFLLPTLAQARQQKQNSQRSSGQQSEVNTDYLQMTLDHDSGTMEGVIIKGPLNGHKLHQLSMRELASFYQLCEANDAEAVRLLDSYIQRHCAEHWQRYHQGNTGQSTGSNSSNGELSLDEAWEVLGLKPGASRDAIIQAHKRMMVRLHPDKGGSNYLASKINQAKDLLLKHCNN